MGHGFTREEEDEEKNCVQKHVEKKTKQTRKKSQTFRHLFSTRKDFRCGSGLDLD